MDRETFALAYDIFLLFGVVVAAFMFTLVWRTRQIAGSTPLLFKMTGEILWMIFYALYLARFVHPASDPFFWSKLTFLGVVLVPVSFLLWTAVFTHRDRWLTPRSIFLLAIEPVLFNLVIWTDPWHGWFSGNYNTTGQLGIAFWIHTLYSYIIIFIAAGMQLIHFRRVQPAFRRQAFLVLMCMPISLLANVMTIVFIKQLKLDFSPVGFLLVGGILVYVQLRHRIFDIMPMARHKVMDEILDGVVVLDNDHRVIDMNPAAQAMLGTNMKTAYGKAAETVIPVWHELNGSASEKGNNTIDCIIGNGERRHIDLTLSVMVSNRKKPEGQLILLRDITQIKHIENALREANSALLHKIEENEALQAKLREQAVRDPLTGLHNRRYLEETLSRELEHTEREREPMSLAIIDLDHFKRINDTYGHDVGDLFLLALADLLEAKTRKSDVACRFGGEEFILVMPGATLETAASRIDTLREEFSAVKINTGAGDISATFSAGLAGYPYHGLDDKSLIAEADRALYTAKQTGRNRLVVAPKN